MEKDLEGGEQLNAPQEHIVHSQQPHRMLGCTREIITSRHKGGTDPLYSVLIKPPLKYCAQFWSLLHTKDVDKLERAQRGATKMLNGLWEPCPMRKG